MWDLKYDWNGKGQNGKSQRDRTWWSSSSLVADVVVPPFRQNDFKTPPPPRCLLLLLNDVVAEAPPPPPPPLLDPLLLLDPIFGQMCVSDRQSEVSEFDWLCFAVWFSYYNVEWISFSSDLLLHLRVEWVSHFTFLFLFVCLVKLFLLKKKCDGEGNEYDYYMGKFWVKGGRLFFLGEKLTLKALLGAPTK